MNIRRECILCVLNQIIRVSEHLKLPEDKQDIIMQKALARTADYNYKHLTPPEFSEFLYDIVIEESKTYDPYKNLKINQNNAILERADIFENKINSSPDPLFTAGRYALAGNIIDYGGVKKFKLNFDDFETLNIDINNYDEFKEKLSKAKTMLYIADNAGEAVFDKFFIKQIKKFNKDIDVYYGVKTKPAINDVTREDAKYIKINSFANIIESGMGMAGTVINKTTEKFKDLYNTADIVISKGQGNFETLEDEEREILFIFKVKCNIVADFSNIPLNSNVFAFNTSLRDAQKIKSL